MQYHLKSNHGIEPQSSTTKTTATKSNKKRRSSTTIDNDSKIQLKLQSFRYLVLNNNGMAAVSKLKIFQQLSKGS